MEIAYCKINYIYASLSDEKFEKVDSNFFFFFFFFNLNGERKIINVPVINTCLREYRKRQERTIGQTNLFVHVQDDVPVVRQVTSSN